MSESPTPAEREAIKEGYSALVKSKSPTSHVVETIVFAFGETGQLVGRGGAFELERLRSLVNAQPAELSEAQIEALADAGNRAINDYYHERACSCDLWPESCHTNPRYANGEWDTDAVAIGAAAVVGLWESMRDPESVELRQLKKRVAELEAELRIGKPWKCYACGKQNTRDVCVICETYRPDEEPGPVPEALIASSGVVIETTARPEDVAPQVTALRGLLARPVEDPRESPLHHDYRTPHDLPEVTP